MKPSSRAASPASLAEARPQLADCGSIAAVLVHRDSVELAPKRERNGENEMRQENVQWHRRGCYSYRCTLGSKDQSYSGSLFFFSFKDMHLGFEILLSPYYIKLDDGNPII